MSLFDGLPDIFTDPDVGFGEPVIYTPLAGAPVTINAIWTERPFIAGLVPAADVIERKVDVRTEDVAEPQEGDTFQRLSTGANYKAVPPFQPDGQGMISIMLAQTS